MRILVKSEEVKSKNPERFRIQDFLCYPNNFEPLAKIIYQNNSVKIRTIQANYMHHKVAKILLHNKDSFLRHIRNGHELSL